MYVQTTQHLDCQAPGSSHTTEDFTGQALPLITLSRRITINVNLGRSSQEPLSLAAHHTGMWQRIKDPQKREAMMVATSH